MASAQSIRLRRAIADVRIKEAADAIALHFDLIAPNHVIKLSYPGNLKEAMVAEETATLLESIAANLGIEMAHAKRPYPVSVNPDENDAFIETDDPVENQRRMDETERRQRGFRIIQGLEKADDVPENDPPIQKMDMSIPDAYRPADNKDKELARGDVELTPDPGLPKDETKDKPETAKPRGAQQSGTPVDQAPDAD